MTTIPLRHPFRIALCALGVSLCAQADWQGKLHTTMEPSRPGMPPENDGEIHAKKGKVRIDQAMGGIGNGYMIYDFKTRKLDMVVPDKKAYVEIDAPQPGSQHEMPVGCVTGSVQQCLESQDFKKTGTETVEGRACNVWERDRTAGSGELRQKIWVPTDAKELVFVKQIVQGPQFTRTTVVKDLKSAPQDDALFEVPKGYAKHDMGEWVRQMGGAGRPPRGQ